MQKSNCALFLRRDQINHPAPDYPAGALNRIQTMKGSIIKQVEEEFDQPFWEVVEGFAADGHSVHATAGLLGYASATPFRKLITRHKITIKFASAQESIFQKESRASRIGKCSPAMKAATEVASAANTGYVYMLHNGIRDTIRGHSKRLGLSSSTAYKRHLVNPNPDYVFSMGSHVKVPTGKGMASAENRARFWG